MAPAVPQAADSDDARSPWRDVTEAGCVASACISALANHRSDQILLTARLVLATGHNCWSLFDHAFRTKETQTRHGDRATMQSGLLALEFSMGRLACVEPGR